MSLSLQTVALILTCALSCNVAFSQSADEQLKSLPQWNDALNAHRDGLAEITILKLREIERLPSLAPRAQSRIRNLLIESLVRAERFDEALLSVQGDELPFWTALAYAALGRLTDAQPLLTQCMMNLQHPAREEAILTLASVLKKLDGIDRAGELLAEAISVPGNESLSPRPRLVLVELHLEQGNYQAALTSLSGLEEPLQPLFQTAADLLKARALIALKRHEQAQELLRTIIARKQLVPSSILNAASLLLADASIAADTLEDALVILTGIIENTPSGGNVLPAFDRIADMGLFKTPSGMSLLSKWQESPKAEINRPAAFFAVATHKNDASVRPQTIITLSELKNGKDPVATRASLLLSEILIENSDKEGALAVLTELKQLTDNESVLARIDFVEAKAKYAAGDFETAADRFAKISERTAAGVASFNAAVSSLRAGNDRQYIARAALLPEVTGQFSRGELQLERALYKSSNHDPGAGKALADFIKNHPKHPRSADAYLAAASINILAWPSKAKSARENLLMARSLKLSETSRERADYLTFWIEESAGENEKAIEYAEQFISKWPKSADAPSIRMRQAEIQFRTRDYLDAMRNFEKLSLEYPDSDLADKAIFFAGRAAMLTLTEEGAQRALTLWQKLAELKSPLAPLARQHQAQIKLSQGMQEEALNILDAALLDEPDTDLKALILILKGRALYELGGKDESRLAEAAEIFAQALALTEISTAARNETLFRKAKVHELLGEKVKTLSCLYKVINSRKNPAQDDVALEFKWYYRAGFEGIRIMETAGGQQNITAAIAIADRLAITPGPRADEARKNSQRLRLEHFIWQK